MVRDIDGPDATSRSRTARPSVSRYDLLLAVIPVALGGAALVGSLFGVELETALLGGVLIAAMAVFDGLFRRPPTGLERA